MKYHAERSKYPYHPWAENILFLARGERYVYLKKIVPRVEISPGGEFSLAYV